MAEVTQVGNATFTWNGDGLAATAERAGLVGLAKAGEVIANQIRFNLARPGTPRSKTERKSLRRGFSDIITGKRSSSRDAIAALSYAARIIGLGGLVDRAGGMPRTRTGELLRSVGSEVMPDGSVLVGAGKEYARIHEYGGFTGKGHKSFIPARPYVRPSFDQAREAAFEAFAAGISEVLAGEGGGLK